MEPYQHDNFIFTPPAGRRVVWQGDPMKEPAAESSAESLEEGAIDTAGENAETAPETAENSAGSGPAEPEPAAVIASLEAQLAGLKDQYLRKAADFENFRKRMNREKQESVDFANQSLILDLIPVVDDLERAMKAAENAAAAGSADAKDFNTLYEGISMTEKRLVSQLENRWGLKRYDSAGQPFDPNRHEAIMADKSAEIAEPLVQEEFLKGYTLRDRVIRAAKVRVVMPDTGAETAGAGV
jgi:molecular chaperone GrpE